MLNNRTILIAGAGIAGPTLAYWLTAGGFEPTLIERAPGLRTGGYVIDFWGLGYDIAERMGLLEDINRIGYRVREMRIVDDRGQRIAGFGTKVFSELTGGRYVTLARSSLSRLLFEKLRGTTEVIFDDEIVGLQEQASFVRGSIQTRRRTPLRSGDRRRWLAFGRSPACVWAAATIREATRLRGRGSRGGWLSPARRGCVSDVWTAGAHARPLHVA